MNPRERLIKLALFGIGGAQAGPIVKALQAIEEFPGKIVGKGLGAITHPIIGAPLQGANKLLRGTLNTAGPLVDTRKVFRSGVGSVKPITMERYKAVMAGRESGYVAMIKGVPVERLTRQGGLLGIAQAHPITSGMIAAGLLMPNSTVGKVSNTLGPQGIAEYGLSGFKPEIAPTNAFTRLSSTPIMEQNPFERMQGKYDWGVRHAAEPIDPRAPEQAGGA